MVTALKGAAASEARGGLGNDRAPHEELHREDLLSCLLLCLPSSLSEALLPSFKCRTSPRLFDGPLAELTLIKQLNPPASLVVRSLCVQKRTLHGGRAPGRTTTARAGDRATAAPSMQLNTDNGGGDRGFAPPSVRPFVRPPGVYVTQSTHSVFQSLRAAVFACPGAVEGRGAAASSAWRPAGVPRARSRSAAWLLPPRRSPPIRCRRG